MIKFKIQYMSNDFIWKDYGDVEFFDPTEYGLDAEAAALDYVGRLENFYPNMSFRFNRIK